MEGLQHLFLVDEWRKQSGAYFLTHMHGDHTKGLSSKWSRGPLYCSPITSRLLCVRFPGFNTRLLRPLEDGASTMLEVWNKQKQELMEVTPIDAHHCPGSVMFLFRGSFGTRLHTGDFRWDAFLPIPSSPANCTPPAPFDSSRIAASCSGESSNDGEDELPLTSGLRQLREALRGGPVDALFLDNTYCHPKYRFPKRAEALEQVLEILTSYPEHRVVIGVDSLGKEDLLVALASRLHTKIGVSPERFAFAQLLGLPDIFTVLPTPSVSAPSERPKICAVPRRSVNLDHLRILNETGPTIGIVPSGWRSLDAASARASERGSPEKRPEIAAGVGSGRTSDQGLRSRSLPLRGGHTEKASAIGQEDPSDEGRAGIDEGVACQDGASRACGPVLTSAEERSCQETALKEAPALSCTQRPKVPPVVRGAAAAAAKMEPLKRLQPMPRAPCQPLLFRVPYSLHSCFAELEAFVRLVRPRVIRPIAQKDLYGLDTCPNTHFGDMCKLWSKGQAQPKPLPVLAEEEKCNLGLLRGVNGRFDDEMLDAEDKALALRIRRSRKRGAAMKVRRVWARRKRLRIGSVSPAKERPGALEREVTCMEVDEDVEVFEERIRNGRGEAKSETGKIVSGSSSVKVPGGQQAAGRERGAEEEFLGCGRRIECRQGDAGKVEGTFAESGLELDVRLGSAAVQSGQGEGEKLGWADKSADVQKVQGRSLARSHPQLSLKRNVVPKSGATTQLKVEQGYGQPADARALSFEPKELDESVGEDAIGSESENVDDDVGCELPAWYLEAHGRWVATKVADNSTPVVKRKSREVPPVKIERTTGCTTVQAGRRTLPYFLLRGYPKVGA